MKIMIKKIGIIFIGFLFFTFFQVSGVYADYTITGSTSLTGTVSVAMPISDLQISGTGTEPIPVKLLVTSGSLSMSTTTGLTFDGASSGSSIYFSGSKTNVNNALATLTYTRGSTGTDTLEVSLVPRGEVFFTDNGHLYKFITGSISANSARSAATGLTAYGATGYLATITSQAENDFVAARLQGDGWMGAGDYTTEGDWKWVSGPESGTSFWTGAAGGHTVGGNYANWSSGEPNDYLNGSPGEDCAQFYISSGKWNDLPCSGTNLSGYVVEFGAPGLLPTVVAKNVSLTTGNNPTANSFSPADNATGITLSANLVIQFSQTITKGTGNILIKKSSDDSTVQTIDVTSAQVSGEGTNAITINPPSDFAESTSYYVIIPGTAFRNATSNYYSGIASSSIWNFSTGDFTNPALSDIAATVIASTSVTITWTTDENSSTKISYGLNTSYGTTTSETDTSPRVTAHSQIINSLLACTTYHYKVISTDASGNEIASTDKTFTTSGCEASTSATNTTSNTLTSSSGGDTSLAESDAEITVDAPANFTDDAASVVIQIKSLASAPVLSVVGRPGNLPREVGDIVFDVKAIINGTTVLDSFDSPVTIRYQYSDADIEGLNEASLWLYHYHNSEWVPLDSCIVSPATNLISCTASSFSIFGLFGKENGTSSSTGDSNSSPATPLASCNSIKPDTIPDLFQIDVTNHQATVYFTPLTKNVTNYFVSYGYKQGEERFAVLTNQGESSGVLSYTINHLNADSIYYFKVRPLNSCTSGDWSNEMQITTLKQPSGKKNYYRYVTSPTPVFISTKR